MKRIVGIILTICIAVTTLSSCNDKNVSHNSDLSSNSSITSASHESYNDTESQTENLSYKVSLTKLQQTGVISDYMIRGAFYTKGNGSLNIPFRYNSTFGYSDCNGNPTIEKLDGYNQNFSDGFGSYHKDKQDVIINSDGNIVFTLSEDITAEPFKNGYSVMIRREQTGGPYEYNYYIYMLDSDMKYTENPISLPDGCQTTNYGVNWYPVNEDGFKGALGTYYNKAENTVYIGIANSQGEIIASFDATKATSSVRSAFKLVNISKSISHAAAVDIGDTDLTKMIFFKNGYVNVIDEDGQWGLMNTKTREMAIDYKYDFVGAYSDGVIPVCNYGSWGLIDINGNSVLPCQNYRYISAFVNDRAIAISNDDKIVVINKSGEIIGTFNGSVSGSTLGGSVSTFFYTDFTETTHLACIYLYEKAYLISDTGETLLTTTKSSTNVGSFLYMNDEYLVFHANDGYDIYKINLN